MPTAQSRSRRRSLGFRWTLRYGLATALALGGLGTYVEDRIERAARRDAEIILELEVGELLAELKQSRDAPPEVLARMIEPELSSANPELRFSFQVFDRTGRERYGLGPLHEHAVALAPEIASGALSTFAREIDLGEEHPYWALCTAAGEDGFVRVGVNARLFVQAAQRSRAAFLGAIPVALLVVTGIGFALARGSLRPVREIVSAARRICSGHLDEDIPRSGSGDEFDQIAAAFNQVLERVRSSMDSLRRFSADAAHQLRSPLTALRSRIEVTLDTEPLPPEMAAFLRGVLADVSQLSELVDGILRLSHSESEAGLNPSRRAEVELGPLLRSVVEFFEPMAEERHQRLHLGGASARVLGDLEWLRQLFVNLVDNAIRYTPEGGRIDLEIDPADDEIHVHVRDTGRGIPAAEVSRIFERFQRAVPEGESPGVGLGLTIARRIAENHGGRIDVESTRGRGTTFRVSLPRCPASAPLRPAAPRAA